ncbi:MAG: LapA family protein [Rhodanobacter sp.]
MRLLAVITLIIFVAVGIVLGALNAGMVDYDFGFAQVQLPKGAALLGALVVGWLLGGVTAWLGSRSSRPRQRSGADRKPPVKP